MKKPEKKHHHRHGYSRWGAAMGESEKLVFCSYKKGWKIKFL